MLNLHRFKSIYISLITIFFLTSITILLTNPHFEGDTVALVDSIPSIQKCISQGKFSNCSVVHFPLFQFVPSLLLDYIGFDQQGILKLLALLSTIFFVGSLLLIYCTLKKTKGKWLGTIATLIMISSPLLWYAKSTFNEMTAAFITLAFTCAVLLHSPTWLIIILGLLTGITKETAFPFIILLGLLALFPEILKYPKRCFHQLLGVLTGVVASLIANISFNYFRFGSLNNQALLQDHFIVDSHSQRFSSFLGIWLSPNGGLLFFWSSLVIYFFSIFTIVLITLINRKRLSAKYVPALTIVIILFSLTLGFSSWWAPFGWYSWGPRLMIPWLPSLLILMIYHFSKETELLVEKVLKNGWRIWLFTILLFVSSLPQVLVIIYPKMMYTLFSPDSVCPQVPGINDLDYYYHCINHYMWTKYPIILYSFTDLFQNIYLLLYGTLYLLFIYSILNIIKIKTKLG